MAGPQTFELVNVPHNSGGAGEASVEDLRLEDVAKDDLTRPPLSPGTYQSIELEQYDIHKRCLSAMRELQVLELPGETPRPKEPARIAENVAAYARALFESEAKWYPDDPRKNQWFAALAPRVEAMLARRIWELDTVSVPKLTYHATREEIDAMMRDALQALVDECALPAAPVPIPLDPDLERVVSVENRGDTPVAAVTAPQLEHFYQPPDAPKEALEDKLARYSDMGGQIRVLRRESRLTIDELAAKIGVAPRTVQRHEAGEVGEIRLRHLRSYERVFTNRLKRPVRLLW